MKQHIDPTAYQGYTVPSPLFIDPHPSALEDSTLCAEAFAKKHPSVYLFPDPFLQPDRPAAPAPLADFQIVIGDLATDRKLAEKLREAIERKWKTAIPIVDARGVKLPSITPSILIGGADSNPCSVQLAKKYQVGLFSSLVPGPGGWGITTYAELEDGAAPCYVISADSLQSDDAVNFFVQNAVSGPQGPTLGWIHHIMPGPELKSAIGSFDEWLAGVRIDLLSPWLDGKSQQPYREAFVDILSQDLSEGLPYNAAVVDLPMCALRHYQMSGDTGGLELFREMMWGLWNYLNGPEPRIYISDIDFRLGLLLNYWNWIQHNPIITDEERAVFPKALLGTTRMVRDYYIHLWREKALSASVINHVTFKARSLLLAARYFRSRAPREAEEYQTLADEAFIRRDLTVSKYAENAANYETFLPEHLLSWREVSDLGVPPEMQQGLSIFALRDWAILDNFLFFVEYGDCDPSMTRQRPLEIALWLEGDTPEQRLVRELERTSGDLFPPTIAPAFRGFTGLHHAERGVPFSGPVGWMQIPLDRLFAKARPLHGPANEQFDKLSWRSGWNPDSTYIALEGIGNEQVAAHTHNESNSILRMNLGGRIWLVNNGYGRRDDLKDAQALFATRKRGPEEHNMLIVRSQTDGTPVLPPPNALLRDRLDAPLPCSVTEMTDYGGVNWRRHLIILPGQGIVVVDRVETLTHSVPPFELQWNVLGDVSETKDGALIKQEGVTLTFQHPETAKSQWQESSITAWRRLIAEGSYPHTKRRPSCCTLRPVVTRLREATDPFFFVCAFGLASEAEKMEMTWDSDSQQLLIKSRECFEPLEETRNWGKLTCRERELAITFH
jgi:hypothetical protein